MVEIRSILIVNGKGGAGRAAEWDGLAGRRSGVAKWGGSEQERCSGKEM